MTATIRIRLAAVLLLLCAAAAVVLAGWPASAPGSSQAVITTGVLRNAAGEPTTGNVRVYAWPLGGQATSLPLVGQTQTDDAGNFTVYAADDTQLATLAAQRGGWLDFVAVGETAGYQGQWTFSSFVSGQSGALRSLAPSAVHAASARAASAAPAGPAPRVAIIARQRSTTAGMSARAAQTHGCVSAYQTTVLQTLSKYAIVGELNNAYNDGTQATFGYGQDSNADTDFGVALSTDNGATYSINGETHVANNGSITFPTVARRYARKLRTKFEINLVGVRVNSCAVWDRVIKAGTWMGGTNDSIKQRGALDKCDSDYPGAFSPGSALHRDSSSAVRWTRGVEAFGVSLTTHSGFSRSVTLDYKFNGPPGKRHYLCGPDGKQSPMAAGRVFSGSAK